jgi:hypothetical protein
MATDEKPLTNSDRRVNLLKAIVPSNFIRCKIIPREAKLNEHVLDQKFNAQGEYKFDSPLMRIGLPTFFS